MKRVRVVSRLTGETALSSPRGAGTIHNGIEVRILQSRLATPIYGVEPKRSMTSTSLTAEELTT